MMKNLLMCVLIASLFTAFTSCNSSEGSKNTRVEFWLTDAPGDFEEVNIDIEGVEIATTDDEGWLQPQVNGGVYNLLELTNGVDTLIGSIDLPSGKISQIRLKLGLDNTVKVNGNIFDLETPSGQQSGIKLQVHETFTEGVTYKILLDFDVARSVVEEGNGSYKLKPVIRTITEAQSGAINGIVSPAESTPAIYAIAGKDTVATTYTDDTGQFLLRGIPAGTYTVTFEPNSGYASSQVTNVEVSTGAVRDLGTITLSEN